jgi:hypothetical protein
MAGVAHAQTFRMPCEAEATIPAMDDLKLETVKVVVEIQSMGKNIFLKVNGQPPYSLIANSLVTEDYDGKNLTSDKQMGAFRKHKVTGAESEIRIRRDNVTLYAYHDTQYKGKNVRVVITGPCTVVPQ